MLAYLLALYALSKSLSLSSLNFSFPSSSWQNTFTTFCPAIISSIYPFTAPRSLCCATKYFPLSPDTFFVRIIITATITKATPVSGRLMETMLITIPTIIIMLLRNCGMLWLIICLKVSTSLVYTDIISPCECVSKYLIGRDSI